MIKKQILLLLILSCAKLQAMQPDPATAKYLKKLNYVANNLNITREQACLFILQNNIKRKKDLDTLGEPERASRLSQTLSISHKAATGTRAKTSLF